MAKKNWRELEVGTNLVKFNNSRNSALLEFLNDGVFQENKEITLQDGSISTIKNNIEFRVLDLDNNGVESVFNVNSARLREAIIALNLKDMTGNIVKITRIQGRKETDNTYKAELMSETKKK